MPLRDHFHPPISKRSSWEGFHGGWLMRIVEELAAKLPQGFVAEPRVHLGNIDAEFPEQYAYEVQIFDLARERRLVAAIEIVSPANKDRPESRQLFIAKCFNLLRQGVCVSIIDLVTTRQFNLYAEFSAVIYAKLDKQVADNGKSPCVCTKRTNSSASISIVSSGGPAAQFDLRSLLQRGRKRSPRFLGCARGVRSRTGSFRSGAHQSLHFSGQGRREGIRKLHLCHP